MTRQAVVDIDPGDLFLIKGVRLRFVRMVSLDSGRLDGAVGYSFEDEYGVVVHLPVAQFNALNNSGDLSQIMESGAPLIIVNDSIGEEQVTVANRRRSWLVRYDLAPVSKSMTALAAFIIENQAALADHKPPSPETLQRWIRERGRPGFRPLGQMWDRHANAPRGRRLDPRVLEILGSVAEEKYWDNLRVSPTDVWNYVAAEVARYNLDQGLEGASALTHPAKSTVHSFLTQGLDYDRACRRFGEREARRQYIALKSSPVAKRLLDVVQIDHTEVDVFVIDEATMQPIGRPTLTFAIDQKSRYPLGYHIGWASAGLEAAFACLRQAVRSKEEVAEKYPDVDGEWLAWGCPRAIRVDQGLEFSGTSFEEACATLGIGLERCPTRTPQWKASIERFFGIANTQLFHKLPGSSPFKPKDLEKFGIDPQTTAILFLSELEELIYRWVVTVYAYEVSRTHNTSPAKKWIDSAKVDRIERAKDVRVVDQACSVLGSERVLDHEGVQLFGLTYCSDEISDFLNANLGRQKRRNHTSGSVPVHPRYHPEDISKIHVWDDARQRMMTLPCVNADYTEGLSLHLHERLKKWARDQHRAFKSEADMITARVALTDFVEGLLLTRTRDRRRLKRLTDPVMQAEQADRRPAVRSARQSLGPTESDQVTNLINPSANRKLGDRVQRRRLLPESRTKKKLVESAAAKHPEHASMSAPAVQPVRSGKIDYAAKLQKFRSNG